MSKIISREVYEYNELSEEAKEKAKQWYLDDYSRGDILTEDFQESCLKYFFPESNLDVQWSLSSCQGDGVNIYGEIDLSEVINYIRNWNDDEHSNNKGFSPKDMFTEEELNKLENYIGATFRTTKIPKNRRYCYCVADNIELADDIIDELGEIMINRENDKNLIHRFEKTVIESIESLCGEMEQMGYDFLYNIEDDEMDDTCECNGWYFEEDGTFANI